MRSSRRGGAFAMRVAVLASALAAALGGCGGSGSNAPSGSVTALAYAGSICRAIGPFERDIVAGASALNPTGTGTATQRKAALEGFLSTVASDTGRSVAVLKAAGYPNIDRGRRIGREFVTSFTRLKSAMDSAAANAKTLPTTSPRAFSRAVTTLGNGVKAAVGSDLGSGLEGLNSRALEVAAKRAPACKAFT